MTERIKYTENKDQGFPPEIVRPRDFVIPVRVMTGLGRRAIPEDLLPGGDVEQCDPLGHNLTLAAACLLRHPFIASGNYKIWAGLPTDVPEGLFEIDSSSGELGILAQRIVIEQGHEMDDDSQPLLITSFANHDGHTNFYRPLKLDTATGKYIPNGKHQRIRYY